MSYAERSKAPTLEQLISDLGTAVKLWWKLDDAVGSATVADSSGGGTTGTVTGGWSFRVPYAAPGIPGMAAHGAGVTFQIASAAGLSTLPAAPPMSLLFVSCPSQVSAVSSNLVGHTSSWLGVVITVSTGNVGSVVLRAGGVNVNSSTPLVYNQGRTHLTVLTVDSNNDARVYVDGIERIAATAVGAGTWNTSGTTIGNGSANTVFGAFAEKIITDTCLTPYQIAAFNAAVPR